jgi:SpoVK/Ycf46/Vps4 family AAA+-type ATPase
LKQQEEATAKFEKDQRFLMLLSPDLHGFCLQSKEWFIFQIDLISPVSYNEEAYDHLVYPEKQKDLVLTFVKNHRLADNGTGDVVKGKGQGLIILLSGPPGTGKTLTAEAVADQVKKPLYHLQAEELGIQANTLGANLSKALEIVTAWKGIVLLDEADVFLARRSPNDIARNELVSIFLRVLEYYQGIMFLTTNLFGDIDDAFRSRIHIHLLYPPLTHENRQKIWEKFMDRADNANVPGGESQQDTTVGEGTSISVRTPSLTQDSLKSLANWNLNGREIKNVVKIVQTWCACKGEPMSIEHLETGLRATAPYAGKDGD